MFEALETGIGLELVLWFQENRSGWLAVLSQILDQLGVEIGYVAILGIIFWAINKREGLRLVFALIIVAIVTFAVKDVLMRERPFVLFPELVQPVFETEGFGFPSGHTSFAVMVWGYIAIWQRKSWIWAFAIFYMILQGTGRMIAGVHYPHSVIAGGILGIITLATYYPLSAQWEQFWKQQAMNTQIILAIAIPLIIAVIVMILPLHVEQIEAYLTLLGLAIGVGTGAVIESRYVQFEPHPDIIRRAIHVVFSIVIVVAVLFGLSPLFDLIAEAGILAYMLRLIRYGLAGFTAIAMMPMLGIRVGLMKSQSTQVSEATD